MSSAGTAPDPSHTGSSTAAVTDTRVSRGRAAHNQVSRTCLGPQPRDTAAGAHAAAQALEAVAVAARGTRLLAPWAWEACRPAKRPGRSARSRDQSPQPHPHPREGRPCCPPSDSNASAETTIKRPLSTCKRRLSPRPVLTPKAPGWGPEQDATRRDLRRRREPPEAARAQPVPTAGGSRGRRTGTAGQGGRPPAAAPLLPAG